MKKVIRLTEGDVRRLVKESVNKVLKEYHDIYGDIGDDSYDDYIDTRLGGPTRHAISASDFDSPEDFENLDNFNYEDEDFDEDFDDMPLEFESRRRIGRRVNEIAAPRIKSGSKSTGPWRKPDEEDEDEKERWVKKPKRDGDWFESRNIIGKALRESIKSVLNESPKMVDPANAVPEDVARKYGFEPEYGGADGYELWGKDIEPGSNGRSLLRALGIHDWDDWNANGHVRITVKTNPKPRVDKTSPRKIGDYVSIGYGDDRGEFFNNPKNGHNRILGKGGYSFEHLKPRK